MKPKDVQLRRKMRDFGVFCTRTSHQELALIALTPSGIGGIRTLGVLVNAAALGDDSKHGSSPRQPPHCWALSNSHQRVPQR